MDKAKLIMDLCEIIDHENTIIREQSLALEQFDAITAENEIVEEQKKCAEIRRALCCVKI